MGSPTREPTGTNLAGMAARDPVGDTRGWLSNTATDEDMFFWFRPAPIRVSGRAVYDTMDVIGMSHGYQTYRNTQNVRVSFELYVNRLMLVKLGAQQLEATNRTPEGNPEAGLDDLRAYSDLIEQDRRFLEALQYPPQPVPGVLGSSPPVCHLYIPGVCTLRCRLEELDQTFVDCDLEGNIKEYRARCTFVEAPMARINMEDVRENGAFRLWGGP